MLVIGYIGPKLPGDLRKTWNALFSERKIDAFFDFYRTRKDDLPLRLSEMFLLERRGYIVDPQFSTEIIALLDRLDCSAQTSGKVDTVVNEGGVLIGYCIDSDDSSIAERMQWWFS
ncbi:MAG: hypothetical protein KBD00_05835 [Candidatus Peribacteraceae bacterium]|nr:hypothetical protein [Candidatus Peribacteraceae bacterium]